MSGSLVDRMPEQYLHAPVLMWGCRGDKREMRRLIVINLLEGRKERKEEATVTNKRERERAKERVSLGRTQG